MRGLLPSLYAVVFVALLSLGWLFDQLYVRLSSEQQFDDHAGYTTALSLAAEYAAEKLPDVEAINQRLAAIDVTPMIEPMRELPLPAELAQQVF